MYTIDRNTNSLLEINKSKFITHLYKVNTLDEINFYLNEIKNEYKDATHCCYAYKIGNIQKFNDDGEPGGTAGLPIIEVLNKKELNYILCVVVRYFGGIKLGAGGLVRAYGNAVKEAIDKINIIELVEGYLINLNVSYDMQKQIDYKFEKYIKKKEYNDNVIYYLEIEKENIELFEIYNYEIIEEKLIEKM